MARRDSYLEMESQYRPCSWVMLQVLLGLVLVAPHSTGPVVTISSLLREMSDRASLARTPAIPFKQLQASSYDRAQKDPKDAKTWFANVDYGQFIRTEQHDGRTEWVAMEHMGAGAITHIWTPLLGEKDKMLVRFYFDGSDKPAIEEPFNDLMRGKGLFKPPFAYISWAEPGVNSGVGSDLYFPIPSAKGCKVTFSEVPFYYSIGYRAYPKNTSVETFTKQSVTETTGLAQKVGQDLGHTENFASRPVHDKALKIPAKADISMKLPKGPNALTRLSLRFDHTLDLQELRTTVVEMTFDGEKTVWCPIGEFFGCGVHSRPVWDRYRSVTKSGEMSCDWRMPYQRNAQLRILNLGRKPVFLRLALATEAWHWDDRSMHFHASWRYQHPLATRPMSDWNYLSATGSGVYVGDTLTVFSPAAGWYGEGDERIYVDGEKFPSHLGTGTEDYYGYAWGMAEGFSSAYIAMPNRDLKGRENWMGYTTTSRVRGLDAIPFDKSIKFDMEIWDWADCKVGYSAATFWYARPGATSNRVPSPQDAIAPLPETTGSINGAIECEDMKVLTKSDGLQVSTQSAGLTEGSWSNNTQLFLQANKPGDFVQLEFPVQKAGRYHVYLYATKSYDYGIVRFSVNGSFPKPVDFFSEKPVASGVIDLGVFDLKRPVSSLRAEVVGTNPKSRGSQFYFGLDCIVVR